MPNPSLPPDFGTFCKLTSIVNLFHYKWGQRFSSGCCESSEFVDRDNENSAQKSSLDGYGCQRRQNCSQRPSALDDLPSLSSVLSGRVCVVETDLPSSSLAVGPLSLLLLTHHSELQSLSWAALVAKEEPKVGFLGHPQICPENQLCPLSTGQIILIWHLQLWQFQGSHWARS